MRAVGYSRSESPASPDSSPDQVGGTESFDELFAQYCDINLHQGLETFVDMDGSSDEYRRMVAFMRDSGSHYLAVLPDARHLGNDLEAVARALIEIEGTGSTVVCMDPELPDPIQNAFQRLGIKGVSRTRSRRVKESMRSRAASGKALGRPPFGYRIGPEGTLEMVPKEAAVVQLIYRLYTSDDMGFRLIAAHLNERGITTRRGSPWNVVTVRDVLRNPAHTGTYARFGLRLPRVHEPTIDAEIFKQAQDRMRSRRPIGRVANAEPFLLSGLAQCASCGNTMIGVTRRQKWKRKDGRRGNAVYRYYQCQSRQNQGRCDYRTWRSSLLEATVLSQLKDRLARRIAETGPDGNAPDGDASEERVGEIKALRQERVDGGQRRLLTALKRVAKGEIPLDLLADYLDALDALRRAVAEPLDGGLAGVLARLEGDPTPDAEAMRAIIAENVTRIVVREEGVEIQI